MATNKDLTKELMKIMNDYVESGSNSCASLARESGVPYSTVVRLLKGGNVPSFESVFPILVTVMNYKSALGFVNKYYPYIGTFLNPKASAPSFASASKVIRTGSIKIKSAKTVAAKRKR